jgi:hypothetical protein
VKPQHLVFAVTPLDESCRRRRFARRMEAGRACMHRAHDGIDFGSGTVQLDRQIEAPRPHGAQKSEQRGNAGFAFRKSGVARKLDQSIEVVRIPAHEFGRPGQTDQVDFGLRRRCAQRTQCRHDTQ